MRAPLALRFLLGALRLAILLAIPGAFIASESYVKPRMKE